ncbi:MAG TPA: hypothetical protein VN317_04985 [Candidatus Methanoperedens sp.]|nr:hypothetical protein [Candidatus Methanoperedens sp.]
MQTDRCSTALGADWKLQADPLLRKQAFSLRSSGGGMIIASLEREMVRTAREGD